MNCKQARELLSLRAGGDLSGVEAGLTTAHLQSCEDCREFYDRLTANQSLLRSLRQDAAAPAALSATRHQLFSRLQGTEGRLGWWIRLERFLLLQARRPQFAVASVALAVIVSVTLFAQLRHVTANPGEAAMIEDGDTLPLPEDYKDWVFVGSASQVSHAGESKVLEQTSNTLSENVYINPDAYQEFKRTGAFPRGTIMILESSKPTALVASVKDERFSGGWGYFRFEGNPGGMASRARALPETAGCAACHRDRAATDHVFTQFYPVLRSASGML